MLDWRRPTNLGIKDGLLAPCRRTPNCVCSQVDPSDREHYIAPLRASLDDVRRAVESLPRTRIVLSHPNYLYAEVRSRLLGYVDDVLIGAIVVDGVNRARIENLRRLLRQKP